MLRSRVILAGACSNVRLRLTWKRKKIWTLCLSFIPTKTEPVKKQTRSTTLVTPVAGAAPLRGDSGSIPKKKKATTVPQHWNPFHWCETPRVLYWLVITYLVFSMRVKHRFMNSWTKFSKSAVFIRRSCSISDRSSTFNKYFQGRYEQFLYWIRHGRDGVKGENMTKRARRKTILSANFFYKISFRKRGVEKNVFFDVNIRVLENEF